MSRRPASRAARRAVVALAALVAAAAATSACAGSLSVRDADGSAWSVAEDPGDNANDYLLMHLAAGAVPDARFGRNGRAAFSLSPANDAPASVRVDAARRIWILGSSLVANQPQPVVARFLADGGIDLHWGVQGKVQITPNGVAAKPNDLLPLADGSVLVAGETTGLATPRAVVFHLLANGTLDRAFGDGGVWQRPGDADASAATSLAAGTDGTAAVSVAVRGAKPAGEAWAMTDAPPALILAKPMDDTTDGDDLRVTWGPERWGLAASTGVTGVVAPALLTNRPAAAMAAAVAAAASDPGSGGFNPFTVEAASAPEATGDDGLPWTWMAVVGGAIVVAIALGLRARGARTVLRATTKR